MRFGVTTVIDMHNKPEVVAYLKKVGKKISDVADFKSSSLTAAIENGWPAAVVTYMISHLHDKSPKVNITLLMKLNHVS